MKALLLNTSFFPNVGGVENSLRGLCQVFSKRKWSVDVITSDCGYLQGKEQLFGANIIRYKQYKYFFFLISMFFEILKIKPKQYDVVISRHTLMTLVLIFLKVDNINFIVPGIHEHQNKKSCVGLLGYVKYHLNVYLEKFVLRNVDNIFVFSNEMKNQINSYFPELNVNKVNPGVDIERFYSNKEEKQSLKESLNIPLNKKIIISVGRFVDVKNFEILIRSMGYLSDDYYLLLVGDGPNKTQYEYIIESLSLHDKVRIIPSSNTPELYYRVSDVFCLPSTYEPFGQVLLEASFSDLVIVAIDSCACGIKTATKEIYKSYDSLIKYSNENTAQSFANTIKVATDTEMKINEINNFKDNYSWDLLLSNILTHNKVQL